jgi:hypothetical protein
MARRFAMSGARADAPEGRGDVGRPRAKHGGARFAQLLFTAIAPQRPDGGNSVSQRRDHIVLAVTQHDAIAGIDLPVGEDVGDKVGLVLEPAVEFGAIGGFEEGLDIEVMQDAQRIDPGASRCRE